MDGAEPENLPPEHLGDYPDGGYWSALVPPGDADEVARTTDVGVSGEVIRLMWDYGVRVPLWDAEGLLPEEPDWLRAALGLGDDLIGDLVRWGQDMCQLDASAGRLEPDRARVARDELNARSAALATRLQQQLGSRFTVVHRRW